MDWADAQGVHLTTMYCRYWECGLPVPARKLGRLIRVPPDTVSVPFPRSGADLYGHRLARIRTLQAVGCAPCEGAA
jgi:hypothetical protein